jgi:thioredoxin 1
VCSSDLTARFAGKAEIVFIDVWADREAGSQYGIRMIPTQIFFDADGNEVFRHEGFFSLEDITAQFEKMGVVVKKE